MAKYLALVLLALFCEWTAPVLGCERKSKCDSDGISTTGIVIISVVFGIMGIVIIIAICLCIKYPSQGGQSASSSSGGGYSMPYVGGGGGGGGGGGC